MENGGGEAVTLTRRDVEDQEPVRRIPAVARCTMRKPHREDERHSSFCQERIRETAHAIEEEPWAWALGTQRSQL